MGSGDDYMIDSSGAGSGDMGSGSGDGWTGDDEDERPQVTPGKNGRRPGKGGKGGKKNTGRKDKGRTDDNFFIGPEYGINTENGGLDRRPQSPQQTTPKTGAAVQHKSVSWTCLSILILAGIKTVIHITL